MNSYTFMFLSVVAFIIFSNRFNILEKKINVIHDILSKNEEKETLKKT